MAMIMEQLTPVTYNDLFIYSKTRVANCRKSYDFQRHLGKFECPTISAILHLKLTYYFHMT